MFPEDLSTLQLAMDSAQEVPLAVKRQSGESLD